MKIAEVRRNKEAAIDDQDFEKAALRDQESKLSEERKAKEERGRGGESPTRR